MSQQYTQNVISLQAEQFNGMGYDTAKSLEGTFSYFLNGEEVKKYIRSEDTWSFHFLPNTLNTIYDGAKFYRANNEPSDSDNVICNPDNLSRNGFTEVPLAASSSAGTVLSITTTTDVSSGYGYICPSKAGELRGQGGMYLGLLTVTVTGAPAVLTIIGSSDFGETDVGESATKFFYVQNSGGVTATSITGAGLAAPFAFAGGSFPGTGGTCTSTLAAGDMCKFFVEFLPTYESVFKDSIEISYNNGTSVEGASLSITGEGDD
jgi:hypothetical protein